MDYVGLMTHKALLVTLPSSAPPSRRTDYPEQDIARGLFIVQKMHWAPQALDTSAGGDFISPFGRRTGGFDIAQRCICSQVDRL